MDGEDIDGCSVLRVRGLFDLEGLKMKKCLGLIAAGVSFVLLGCIQVQSAPPEANSAPPVEQVPSAVQPEAWDFGQVKQGEVTEHDFILKNESDKPLMIKEVTTSCGCTVSKVDKKMLLPGEEAPIKVKFNSKGYLGPVKQHIFVATDSLDRPVIRYIITADVIAS
jgi:hypothetical protein